MPLCARCTGMYSGIVAAMAVHLVVGKFAPSARLAAICVGAVLLGGVEALAEWLGWPGTNALRFVSGLIMGAGIGTLLGVGLRALIGRPRRRVP